MDDSDKKVQETYLDHGCSVTLWGTNGNHIALSVHQDTLSFHVAALNVEASGCVYDSNLLNQKNNLVRFWSVYRLQEKPRYSQL